MTTQLSGSIVLFVTTGSVVRDFLRCGFLDWLQRLSDRHIVLVTPLWNHPWFREEFGRPGVTIWAPRTATTRLRAALVALRRKALFRSGILDILWRRAAWFATQPHLYDDLFQKYSPAIIVFPTPRGSIAERQLVMEAQARYVPTLCAVSSWDNFTKGEFASVADTMAVWNQMNFEEAVALHDYEPSQVHIVGPLQFDPYFQPDLIVARAEYLKSRGWDPKRKLILVATAGPHCSSDQTFVMDALQQAQSEGRLAGPVQMIIRVHFADKTEFFLPYLSHPHIYLDDRMHWYKTVMPGGWAWTTTLDDIRDYTNLLAHADVVINMASTITLEAAIFDTPTIIVAYSPREPERAQTAIVEGHFQRHFRPIVDQGLTAVARSDTDLIEWVNRYLGDPKLHHHERARMVQELVGFTDGESGKRLAELVLELALRERIDR